MTWNDAFGLSNSLALAGWLILFLAPRRSWLLATAGLAIPLALALSYALLIMQHLSAAGGGFGSIEAVRALFRSDPVLVAGWQHYLAYDLFVGAWIARRLDAADVHRLVQWPILGACFLFGPIGFLLGLALEGATRLTRPLSAEA
ncbi:MAG TPA: ABA4-like family protein [Paracoccaceae bacterium]|nr:ABA4-like family protein [Paracoccaceae bacterium]